jgi:hypothetical protein
MEVTSRVFKLSEERRAAARARRKRRLKKDPEYRASYTAYHQQFRIDNREELTLKSREYQRKNALHIKLRRKGLTIEDYDRIVAQHGGVCDICGGPPDGRWGTFTLDHCHETGALRGLLCSKCNRGIGYFKDDPDRLMRAVKYLRRSRK